MNKVATKKSVDLKYAAPKKPVPAAGGNVAWSWLALSACIILLDQITKVMAKSQIVLGGGFDVTPYLNLVHVRNPGAAFSFLADAGGWQKYFLSGLAAFASIMVLILLFKYSTQKLFAFAMSCILGGALGNLIDRVAYGAVIDFLDVHYGNWHWPAFNVADIAISCGAVALVLDEILRVKRGK
ncbi:MAG: signal peptidase II [Burkholderiales bacterium]|jgi:signal peptidase II|nr:signal peptidase II [Burkholderiales bacterium]